MQQTKISNVRDHMGQGRWQDAIRIAARFPQLGAHRNAILDAHMAFTNPAFCRGIKKDPEALIAAGRAALVAAYIKP
jgi:hypothetical protein